MDELDDRELLSNALIEVASSAMLFLYPWDGSNVATWTRRLNVWPRSVSQRLGHSFER